MDLGTVLWFKSENHKADQRTVPRSLNLNMQEMEMIIGILGLMATVIFGLLSIDLFKRKRRPCKLTYFPAEAINLYRNLTKGFDNLDVLKNKQPIKNNIVYQSGVLVSNGDTDITGDNHIVQMCLPEGFRWMDIKIDSCSEGVEAQLSILDTDQRIAALSFNLFRINEYIKIKSLIEYRKDNDVSTLSSLCRRISFSHRIENTGDVEIGEIIRHYIPLKRLYIIIVVLHLLFIAFFSIIFFNKSDNVIYKNIKTGQEYSCMVSDDNMIELHSRSLFESLVEWQPKKISVKDFTSQYIPVYKYKQMNFNMLSVIIVYSLLYIICFITIIPYLIKARRINKHYLLYRSSEKEE